MPDSVDLERFVAAQDAVMDAVLRELRAGRKASHWMWFVFPQLRGLGHSAAAWHYGLASLEEARAYLAHPVLGPRLERCTALVNAVPGRSAHDIFGSPDSLKFRSSMTLFARARPGPGPFRDALDRFHGGEEDPRTLALLAGRNAAPG